LSNVLYRVNGSQSAIRRAGREGAPFLPAYHDSCDQLLPLSRRLLSRLLKTQKVLKMEETILSVKLKNMERN
jgi:hypothetical protein